MSDNVFNLAGKILGHYRSSMIATGKEPEQEVIAAWIQSEIDSELKEFSLRNSGCSNPDCSIDLICDVCGFYRADKIQSIIDAEVSRRVKHCEKCGGDWADTGLNAGCKCEEITQLKADAKTMANCLESMKDAGFSYGMAVNAAIERAKKK